MECMCIRHLHDYFNTASFQSKSVCIPVHSQKYFLIAKEKELSVKQGWLTNSKKHHHHMLLKHNLMCRYFVRLFSDSFEKFNNGRGYRDLVPIWSQSKSDVLAYHSLYSLRTEMSSGVGCWVSRWCKSEVQASVGGHGVRGFLKPLVPSGPVGCRITITFGDVSSLVDFRREIKRSGRCLLLQW